MVEYQKLVYLQKQVFVRNTWHDKLAENYIGVKVKIVKTYC